VFDGFHLFCYFSARFSLSVFFLHFLFLILTKKEMNVTFTSKKKKTKQHIVNYFYTQNLSNDNIHAHVKHLRDKYARCVTLVVHDPPPSVVQGKPIRSKKMKIRIEEKI